MVGTLLLPVLLGLMIAVLTNASGWATWVRYAFVRPYAISGTATAVIWCFMLRSDDQSYYEAMKRRFADMARAAALAADCEADVVFSGGSSTMRDNVVLRERFVANMTAYFGRFAPYLDRP